MPARLEQAVDGAQHLAGAEGVFEDVVHHHQVEACRRKLRRDLVQQARPHVQPLAFACKCRVARVRLDADGLPLAAQ
jgi:hypothetical protein